MGLAAPFKHPFSNSLSVFLCEGSRSGVPHSMMVCKLLSENTTSLSSGHKQRINTTFCEEKL